MIKENKIVIAIDGYSSTGKSTIAKRLAKKLGYEYIDTGAMYRAVTYFAMKNKLIGKDFFEKNKLLDRLPEINLRFKYNPKVKFSEMYLNGENIEKEIRTIAVSQNVSRIAAVSEVRRKLVEQQREMGKNKGLVMDGRDIGTVVFPDADLKLLLTASAEKRANRRYKELIERGDKVSYKEVFENVLERDRIDSTRKDSPLKKANDAIEIDNSDMGLEEQFTRIYNIAQRIIAKH
ncbi:MAG: cytidylate kinase [Flavobacteriales bacterium]|nr:MAG: cytidylate kinase [Flavobacteriales bacterium]